MSPATNERRSDPPTERPDEGFQVLVAPVGPRAGRRWRIVALAGVAALALAIVLGRLAPTSGPDRDRAADLVRPSAAPATLAPPAATPLPAQQWFTGPEAPLDSVLLDGDAVHWLHLSSARATDPLEGLPGRDLVLRTEPGGTLCLCFRPAVDGVSEGAIEAIRTDDDLDVVSRSVLWDVPVDASVHPATRTLVAIEPGRDGTTALVAWLIPSRPAWSVGLETIDLAADAVADSVDLSMRRPRSSYFLPAVPAPSVRMAPDGRHAIVAVAAPSGAPESDGSFAGRAWVVGLDGTQIGATTPLELGSGVRLDRCAWIDFVRADVVAAMCAPDAPGDDGSVVHRWGLDGRALPGPLRVADLPRVDPLIDQATGLAFLWDPLAHRLVALDVVSGVERSVAVPGRDDPAAVVHLERGASRPSARTTAAAWSDGAAATAHPTKRRLVGSPDGRWLYAIGATEPAGGSTGIWRFRADTLELVERWPALARYDALALTDDGRWLLALGEPGVTSEGAPAAWGVSLTVHDVRSGRAIRRIGDVALGGSVAFHRGGPRAVAPAR